jgi:acyl carrier protein
MNNTVLPFTRESVRAIVIDVLTEIQTMGGNPVPDFTDELHPMSELAGFDSMNAVEVAVLLSERLGTDIPDGVFAPEGDEPAALWQVVERLCRALAIGDVAVPASTETACKETNG